MKLEFPQPVTKVSFLIIQMIIWPFKLKERCVINIPPLYFRPKPFKLFFWPQRRALTQSLGSISKSRILTTGKWRLMVLWQGAQTDFGVPLLVLPGARLKHCSNSNKIALQFTEHLKKWKIFFSSENQNIFYKAALYTTIIFSSIQFSSILFRLTTIINIMKFTTNYT